MRNILFVLLFLFAGTLLFGQTREVDFNPKQIDNSLKSKPFFKEGNFIYVDDTKFENDTNYFTIYIVNNSDTVWNVPTVEGDALTGLVLYLLPKELKPYKEILRLENLDWVSCGNSLFNEKLNKGEYILQTIKIPCINCSKENLQRVRFDFENFRGYINYGEPKEYYFSNPFSLYYDEYDFEKFTENIQIKDFKHSIVIGGDSNALPKELTKENLRFLDRKLVLDSSIKNQRITSFNLIFTKRGEVSYYRFKGDKISKGVVEMLNLLKDTDLIVLKNITTLNLLTGEKENLQDIPYLITD